jgi:type IV secretory pathway VirJ component
LPLVEVPATAATGDILAVMVSGDGGWAGLDKDLAASLARRGVPVVGLDSLQYFWSPKTPDELGRDLQRILAHYLEAWGKSRALLVGYSLGAEALPFMVSRLPLELVARVPLVALVGPGSNLELEIHVSDWLGGGEHGGLPVLPEVRKLDRTRILCIYGEEEAATLCRSLEPAQRLGLAGGHHFGGDYQRLASAILDALGVRP